MSSQIQKSFLNKFEQNENSYILILNLSCVQLMENIYPELELDNYIK